MTKILRRLWVQARALTRACFRSHLAAIQVESGNASGAFPGDSNVVPLTISRPKPSVPVSLFPHIPHHTHIPAWMPTLVIPAEAEALSRVSLASVRNDATVTAWTSCVQGLS